MKKCEFLKRFCPLVVALKFFSDFWVGGKKAAARAETITEFILERAGQIFLKTFLLELIAFRLIPVICAARRAKPESCWKR